MSVCSFCSFKTLSTSQGAFLLPQEQTLTQQPFRFNKGRPRKPLSSGGRLLLEVHHSGMWFLLEIWGGRWVPCRFSRAEHQLHLLST